LGLILAPNERWNPILHMRVVRNCFQFSSERVSNLTGLVIKLGKY